jgi:hypothetical protein
MLLQFLSLYKIFLHSNYHLFYLLECFPSEANCSLSSTHFPSKTAALTLYLFSKAYPLKSLEFQH